MRTIMSMLAKDLINYARYPIATQCPKREAILTDVQEALEEQGCAVLKGFLSPNGIAAAVAETEKVADNGHRSYSRTNAYFTTDDPSLPQDDPRRQFFDRSNAFIPADNFAAGGALRTVHNSPGFDPVSYTHLTLPTKA